jgi:putative methyltransferase (TIGR04325 family)
MLRRLVPQSIREARYRSRFVRNTTDNLFMGSFESFAAAQAGAPPAKAVGYDNAEKARNFYSHQIYLQDYPALFWIGRSLDEGMRSVFDLGGHVGIKYYAFNRLLNYPEDLRWTVCDVPGVIKTGHELALELGSASQLGFTSEYGDATGFDVLFASGSLQYLPQRLSEILASLPVKPKRIIVNTAAVHPERTLFTLNNIGFATCPYRIQHHNELLSELTSAGYKRLDGWRNEGKPIHVPFVEGGDKPFYAGCCFDLR